MSIPPNFPLINSSVPINAISSIKDLEGKTLPEIWSIICALSNYNSSLLNTIIQLNGTIRQKDDDINILRGQLSDMAALKTTYARLCEETKVLEMRISELLSNEVSSERRISELENEVASIKEGISAREIGNRADNVALKKVFPNAMKRPFCIRTLSNLVKFIDDPKQSAKDGLCSPEALASWSRMNDAEINNIKEKLSTLTNEFPALMFSIKTLKDNWKVAHNITTVSGTIDYFRALGDEMVDALEICSQLLSEVESS